ncbi:MAG: M23 family metallopeptidase [Burkholderiales bacterium]
MEESALPEMPRLTWPAAGRLTSHFGMRHGRMHEGIDLAAAAGVPVHAALGGVVLLARELCIYGQLVVIVHGRSLSTVYAHLGSLEVAQGDAVDPQARLGTIGSTGRSFGPHLHFEVRFDGTAVDPLVYLKEAPRS